MSPLVTTLSIAALTSLGAEEEDWLGAMPSFGVSWQF